MMKANMDVGFDVPNALAGITGNMTPLEYMLAVMNNPMADNERRDKMAIAAAPFVHLKALAESGRKGKKEEAEDRAKDAATGRFAPRAAPKLAVANK